jgi:hypothetical protein
MDSPLDPTIVPVGTAGSLLTGGEHCKHFERSTSSSVRPAGVGGWRP